MATTVDEILVRIDADLSDLKREMAKATRETRRGSNAMVGAFGAIKLAVTAVGTAIAVNLTAKAVNSFIDVARSSENLQIQLGYLFGSVEEGARAFDEMVEFAGKVPFSLKEIQAASSPLGAVSKDAKELSQLLELTGDVAAVTGLSFQETALQIQRSFSAGIGAADQFRDRGVTALLGFEAGASYTAAETVAKFEEAFGEGGKFHGASQSMADTFDGAVSMLGDSLFKFQKAVGEAGFFDEIKLQLTDLKKITDENDVEFQEFAANISSILVASLRGLKDILSAVISTFNDLMAFFRGFTELAAQDPVGLLFMSVDQVVEQGRRFKDVAEDISSASKKTSDSIDAVKDSAETATKSLNDLAVANKKNTEIELSPKQERHEAARKKLRDQRVKALAEMAKIRIKDRKDREDSEEDYQNQQLERHENFRKTLRDQRVAAIKEVAEIEKARRLAEEEGERAFEEQKLKNHEDFERKKMLTRLKNREEMKKMLSETNAEEIKSLEDIRNGIENNLITAMKSGESAVGALADSVKSAVADIIAEFLRMQIIRPVLNNLFSAGATAISGKKVQIGQSASGGMLQPNLPTLVGERGPELIMSGSGGSRVLNAHNTKSALSGGSSVYNTNVNVTTGVENTVRAEVLNMIPIIERMVVNSVADTRRRGGKFASAIQG